MPRRTSKVPVKSRRGVQVSQEGLVRQTKPGLYNRAVHKKIVTAIEKGASIKDAGLLAGLGTDTLDGWLYSYRSEPEKYAHYKHLVEDIQEAKARRRQRSVERIEQAAQGGAWQADAWHLERTDPENWGRKDQVKVESNEGPRIQLNTVVLVDTEARELSRDLLRRIAGPVGTDLAIGPGDSVHVEDGEVIAG